MKNTELDNGYNPKKFTKTTKDAKSTLLKNVKADKPAKTKKK